METSLIHALTDNFEAHAQQTEGGVEFWLGRDLQHLLGYTEWRNFTAVISKAKTACEVSGHAISDHFVDVNKTIQMPKSAEKASVGCIPCTMVRTLHRNTWAIYMVHKMHPTKMEYPYGF